MAWKVFPVWLGRLIFGVVAVALLFWGGATAPAQDERPEVKLLVEGGIDGWVDPHWPIKLEVRIETDILLVGELQVVQGQELARLEVEVPAGGVRAYEVVVAPPIDQRVILLRVIPEGGDDETPVASAFFRPRVAAKEILVGLVGQPRLEQVLGEVRSAVSGEPITPVGMDDASDRLERGELHQLSYLVMDQPRPLTAGAVSWLKGGGRLVTTAAALEMMGLDAVLWGNFPGVDTRIGWYGVGEGEVLALDALNGHPTQLWASLLRPARLSGSQQIPLVEGTMSLTQAALSVESETPGYPWLPLVVVVYAVVVGPINLWILRRRRKLEWAWLTIPALGLIGVVAFSIVGTGGVNRTFWSHGTVQVSGPDPQARTGMVAATSRARTMEISFSPEWDVYPENLADISGDSAQPRITESGVYQYDLPSLGWLSVNAFRRAEPAGVEVAFGDRGVEMINASPNPVVMWGVHAYPRVAVGGALAPGATGSFGWREVLSSASWWQFHDAFWGMDAEGTVGDLSEHWPIVIGSLVNVATESGMVDVPSFAFAVTEQPISDVVVDGRPQVVSGLKLDLYPIPADRMGETGWAHARPVWLDEAFRAGGFEGAPVFAELWILSYRLPTDLSVSPRLVLGGLDPGFVGLDRAVAIADGEGEVDGTEGWEAWDWEAAEFVPVDIEREMDAARIVAPSGEVLLRVSTARLGVSPLTAVMTWRDAP
ncbi:MAG: hypothetical protein OXI56_10620 [bacterium]|nr:hypothetical protein [bacterium]